MKTLSKKLLLILIFVFLASCGDSTMGGSDFNNDELTFGNSCIQGQWELNEVQLIDENQQSTNVQFSPYTLRIHEFNFYIATIHDDLIKPDLKAMNLNSEAILELESLNKALSCEEQCIFEGTAEATYTLSLDEQGRLINRVYSDTLTAVLIFEPTEFH